MFPLYSAILSVTPLYSASFPPKIIFKGYFNNSRMITSIPMENIAFTYDKGFHLDSARFYIERIFNGYSTACTAGAKEMCFSSIFLVFFHSS